MNPAGQHISHLDLPNEQEESRRWAWLAEELVPGMSAPASDFLPLDAASVIAEAKARRRAHGRSPQPVSHCYFTPNSTKAFLFAIPWTAFALFWTYAAAGFEMPDLGSFDDLFCLIGVPFI